MPDERDAVSQPGAVPADEQPPQLSGNGSIQRLVRARGFGEQTAQVAMVNADYDLAKEEAVGSGRPHTVTIRIWERRWKLKAGQLLNFRANLPRKKTPVPDMEWGGWAARSNDQALRPVEETK